MSIDTKERIFGASCFGNISTKYCEPKKGNKKITFHDNIQDSKDFIFNFFEKQPYFNELMPIIIKNNRGTHFYKKIIKKGLEAKSDFFKSIMKAIKRSNEEDSPKLEKTKKLNYYKIPRLELLKRRKKKLDNYLLHKSKTANSKIKSMRKSKSTSDVLNSKNQPSTEPIQPKSNIENNNNNIENNTVNNFNNIDNNTLNNFNNTNYNLLNSTITADTFHTNNVKNESMMNFHNKFTLQKNNMGTFYMTKNSLQDNIDNNQKDNSRKYNRKHKKIEKLNNIINKCDEAFYFAQNMGDDVEKTSKNKSMEEIGKKLKDVLESRDKKVIEDKGKGNKKYRELEREKFNELKRKMDIKVSDVYAYVNRREINDFMRDNDTIFAYQIYLRDMNKINDRLAKKKVEEKKTISLVKELLENTYRQKEFLKYKIDKYYIKNAKQDELKIFNFKNKDDFYANKNNDKEELKGSILPKIFKLKDFCYGRSKYNPMADMRNIYNEK